MLPSGWPITLLLLRLLDSATSSPVSIYTPAPPLPSQISPPSPFPTLLPSLPSPSLSVPPPIPPFIGNSGESTEKVCCHLTMSPSTLVVRFGDPVTANCSLRRMGSPLLGWEVSLAAPAPTEDGFLVWSVDSLTDWSVKPSCWALCEQGGECHINLSLIVFKPPDNVSISFVGHSGPMLEGGQYTLQCAVQDVAPAGNLTVTFFSGRTVLGQLWSNSTEKKPVTESFTLNINPSKEDDGVQYWCEAKLELGPEGPQRPPVVTSSNITATVYFGPHLDCPTKLQVREGERLSCEVTGNPQPLVTWCREDQVVTLPTHPSRKHAGNYTVMAKGLRQKNFTVELEVLICSGPANSCNRLFLLAVWLIQMVTWL